MLRCAVGTSALWADGRSIRFSRPYYRLKKGKIKVKSMNFYPFLMPAFLKWSKGLHRKKKTSRIW